MNANPQQLATDAPRGELETVALFDGAMPTGVTVSRRGRIFVNFPKWGDDVRFTVAEVRDGDVVPFPDRVANETSSEDPGAALVSVQSVVVDPADKLWILDTGRPLFQLAESDGPKLLCVDLETDRVAKKILFPQDVALPTTYLNDVRFDLTHGEEGFAYITDSSDTGPNAIIVVDLASGESWRCLHDHPTTVAEQLPDYMPVVEGRPMMQRNPDGTTAPMTMGADGIAIAADGRRLFYCKLTGRRLYSVSTAALRDRSLGEGEISRTVIDHGDKGGAGDGMETDAAGNIYATNFEHNAVLRRRPDGSWETVVHDPRLLWPDTMSVATDGYLYLTANQLHRQPPYQNGEDLRQKPYALFRVRIDEGPIQLR